MPTETEVYADLARLCAEVTRLSSEIAELRRLLYGNGGEGLKTTVTLLQRWIERQEAREAEEQKRVWQLKLAIWGWVVVAALSIGSRFL
ncbi:MAG: hypothetical protein QXX12_01070 [Nanopusillaceae archaeon]